MTNDRNSNSGGRRRRNGGGKTKLFDLNNRFSSPSNRIAKNFGWNEFFIFIFIPSLSLSLSLSPQIRFVRHHWLAISWGCEIIFNCQRENTIKNLNSAHPYRRHYRRHKRDNSRNRKSCLLTGSIIITFNKSILVNLVSGIIGINPSRIRRILCKFVGIWIKLHAERERAREIYKIVSNFGIIFDH